MRSVSDCVTCDVGHFCPTGAANQIACSPGAFAASDESGSCDACAAGQFQPAFGATACISCPAGSYCALGASSPSPCEAGTTSNFMGLTASSGCVGVAPHLASTARAASSTSSHAAGCRWL